MESTDLSFIWLEILDLRCQKWFMSAKTIRFTHRMKKELREIPVGEIVLPDHLKPKTK